MKRFFLILFIGVIILGSAWPVGFEARAASNTLASGTFSIKGISINQKTYIPLREAFEGTGYKVQWLAESKTVAVDGPDHQLLLRDRDVYFVKDGVLKRAQSAPVSRNGRLLLPLETAKIIFKEVALLNKDTIAISKAFNDETATLPRLKDQTEYQKLLSFFPQQPELMYAGRDVVFETTAMDSNTAAPSADSGAGDFSQTNNQVSGVDEADLVKTDGQFLYTIKENRVQIFKLGRESLGPHLEIDDPKFYPQQLFVSEDYLIVLGTGTQDNLQLDVSPGRIGIMPIPYYTNTQVALYALDDLGAKKVTRLMQYDVPGSITAARLIDHYVYLITNEYSYQPLEVQDIAYFPGHISAQTMFTAGINLQDLTESGFHLETYLGAGHTAYVSQDALYLAGQAYSGMWWRQSTPNSDLYSFDLSEGKINFRAKGSVPGYLLNQFSMDTYNDYFRVATTQWTYNEKTQDTTTSNDIYIFDKNLVRIGELTGLAPGENIYSTRFMGSKLYMVTYRQVDPFYVIDLAIPEAPKVLGYLKIPGYSNYLHPYDDKTIIGIGMETKDLGDRVVNAGVKLSLFDISDLNNPIEKDKLIIGTGNSYTDVSWDHKAFLFDKVKNLMALPIMAETAQGFHTSKDAYIISFTDQGLLNLRGIISHHPGDLPSTSDYAYDWSTHIQRILYVGNDLYTLSDKYLQLNDLNTLEAIKAIKR